MSEPSADPQATALRPQRALLVGVVLPGTPPWEAEESLNELGRLADTATLGEAGRVLQRRQRVDATYYVGKGKAAQIQQLAADGGADLIVFDNDLSPAQMRNLEKTTGTRILDRSGLILDIFARHARTRTAQIQVELAQLQYLLPRLTGQWTHLSRQAGGGAIRGMGAVGTRGPGETQLEMDRRAIRSSIRDLREKLERIGTQMAVSRRARREAYKVVLVGYTNAGKSTLMRALSGAQVRVMDRLFATLDSTTRQVELDSHQHILLTDTVGFIRKLPHHLFASFRATLEVAVEADLLLHVVDLSHPHYQAQMETVQSVLRDLQLEDRPQLVVYNKVDCLAEGEEERVGEGLAGDGESVRISALTGLGLEALREQIRLRAQAGAVVLELAVPQSEGRLLSRLYAGGEVLARSFEDNTVRLRLSLDRSLVSRMQLGRFRVAETVPS
ncbi:MAG: GTPase HflX [Candidatus Latescibacterota bacterium]